MKIFQFLLKNLINGVSVSLYNYNQYFLKEFFEYALQNKEYINNIQNGNTGLDKDGYCPKHEQVIIVACIKSLSMNKELNSDINIFYEFYKEYLNFKTSSMGWRGRLEWFDFHRSIFTYFILEDDYYNFSWTWKKMKEYMNNFKKKYPRISDWRRKWYMAEILKIKTYVARICIDTNKIDFVSKLISDNYIKINQEIKSIFIQSGYSASDDNKIILMDFVNTEEWNWLHFETSNTRNINILKTLNICIKTNCYKYRIISFFENKSSTIFWKFFINLNNEQFCFLTNRLLFTIIKKYNFVVPNQLKHKIISKIIFFNYHIKKMLFNIIVKSMKTKIHINTAIQLLLENYNTIQQYNYSFHLIKRNIKQLVYNSKCNPLLFDNIDSNKIFYLYSILNDHILPIVKNQIKNFNIPNNCECSICFNKIKNNDIIIFPCNHYFDKSCIKNDIEYRNHNSFYNCPMCRSKIHVKLIKNFL